MSKGILQIGTVLVLSAVIAVMFLINVIGYVVDGVVFKGIEHHLQNKGG